MDVSIKCVVLVCVDGTVVCIVTSGVIVGNGVGDADCMQQFIIFVCKFTSVKQELKSKFTFAMFPHIS